MIAGGDSRLQVLGSGTGRNHWRSWRVASELIEMWKAADMGFAQPRIWQGKIRILRFCVAFALVAGCAQRSADDRGAVAREVANQIFVGMPAARVGEILEEAKIEYSYVTREEIAPFYIRDEATEFPENIKGRYVAIVRDVERNALTTKAMSIEIDIDTGDSVSRVYFEPIYTGL